VQPYTISYPYTAERRRTHPYILLVLKQVFGIVDGTEEAPDAKDGTEFTAWMMQHGNAQLTILLAMERSLQQQYGVQQDAKVLWDQLKEDFKSKVKLIEWALQDEMSAVRLGDCENVQNYASKIQGYMNNFNLCANSGSSTGWGGTMPMSNHTYILMKGVPKDDDWRFFTKLMYDKINTLADTPEEVVTKMKAQEGRSQKEDDSEVAVMFSNWWTKREKHKSKQIRKSRMSHDTDSERDWYQFGPREACKSPHQLEGYSGMLQMPYGGAHCTVMSKHGTGGERRTDRDSGSGNDDDDNIDWEQLDDSYEQGEHIEGKLVLGLCHHLSHSRRSARVRTVHAVCQKR